MSEEQQVASEKKPLSNDDWVALRRKQRELDKEAWGAWWQALDMDTKGSVWPRLRYHIWKAVDTPITWWRETVVEPLQDKNKKPYYHRKLSRAPYIDECGVNDQVCIHEANKQFRYDKMVDEQILEILKRRLQACTYYHHNDFSKCTLNMEDYEEAELNFFIKYGELGAFTDVRHCYWKQKHRLVWERRHPEIMEKWQKKVDEHKEKLKNGEFDGNFWKRYYYWADKSKYNEPYVDNQDKTAYEEDRAISKDWQYYKDFAQKEEFAQQEEKKKGPGPKFWF